MKIPFLFLCGATLLFLSACATTPAVSPQVTAAIKAHHVNQGTYEKTLHGESLDYNDIVNLVKKRVASSVIVAYLRSTEQVYQFSHKQLRYLRSIGAKPELLNYLNETEGFYGPRSTIGHHFNKYLQNNVLFNPNQKKIYYNDPITPCWYDSAYEQSCYSPFYLD